MNRKNNRSIQEDQWKHSRERMRLLFCSFLWLPYCSLVSYNTTYIIVLLSLTLTVAMLIVVPLTIALNNDYCAHHSSNRPEQNPSPTYNTLHHDPPLLQTFYDPTVHQCIVHKSVFHIPNTTISHILSRYEISPFHPSRKQKRSCRRYLLDTNVDTKGIV